MRKVALAAAVCTAITIAGCNEKPVAQTMTSPAVAAPGGPELWGGALYGMTPDQVKSTSTEIADAAKPAGTLHNGSTQLFERRNIDIARTSFKAEYYFLDSKLNQVTLVLDEPKVYSEAEFSAKQIKEALISKYGHPLSCDIFSGGFTKGYSCNWKRQDGNVILFLAAVDEASPTLNIVYQVRLAQDASKL